MKKLEEMSREEKKVAVAKDVIEHLNLIKPTHGIYCETWDLDNTTPRTGDAQPYIDKVSKNCQVCALGACMLSYVRLFDSFDLCDMGRGDNDSRWGHIHSHMMRSSLRPIFTYEELCAIEENFEHQYSVDDQPADEHLRNTMQWIIDRKGDIPVRSRGRAV